MAGDKIRSRRLVTMIDALKDLLNIIDTLRFRSVSLGWATVELYGSSNIEQGQLGYSVDPNGNSLVGEAKGDWLRQWIVIGYEGLCGDPIFVDISSRLYPVYTAMHGMGNWEPTLIAASIQNFIRALGFVRELSAGRETAVKLESNPVPAEGRDECLSNIASDNPAADLEFWRLWFNSEEE